MMTDMQKAEIARLRTLGYGYKAIAKRMGMPLDTVKSYCRRHKINKTIIGVNCIKCGELIIQTPGHKQKKFCSDECRLEYWRAVPKSARNLTKHSHTCEMCGRVFENTVRKQRFCSRKCQAEYRRGGVPNNSISKKDTQESLGESKEENSTILATFLQRLDASAIVNRERVLGLPAYCLCSLCPSMINGQRRCQDGRNADMPILYRNQKPSQQEEKE